jgi:hypothetical protein
MRVIDAINAEYGREAIRLAGSGIRHGWKLRSATLSSIDEGLR